MENLFELSGDWYSANHGSGSGHAFTKHVDLILVYDQHRNKEYVVGLRSNLLSFFS